MVLFSSIKNPALSPLRDSSITYSTFLFLGLVSVVCSSSSSSSSSFFFCTCS
nr:wsv196 [Shrimp white spot syndrome virus]